MISANSFPPGPQPLFNACGAVEAVRKRLWYTLELCFYSCEEKEIWALPLHQFLHRDRFDDLQYYERCEREQMSLGDYRRESARRRGLGYHLYTLVEDGRLVFYGWLVDRQARSEDPLMGQVFFPPADASVVFDCFTHPAKRGHGLYYRALCQMLHDARAIAHARQVCLGVFADNAISRHVIEKAGFRYLGSMIKQRHLFRVQRYAVAAGRTFQTALL